MTEENYTKEEEALIKKCVDAFIAGLEADMRNAHQLIESMQAEYEELETKKKDADGNPDLTFRQKDTIHEQYSMKIVELEKQYAVSEYIKSKILQLRQIL